MLDQNDTVDRLKVMLHQESRVYSCPDYFAPDYVQSCKPGKAAAAPTAAPFNVVEHCIRLVTDLSLHNNKEYSTSPNDVKARLEQPNNMKGQSPIPKVRAGETALLIPSWRAQMCTWAFSVAGTFGFSRSIVGIAFDILDRYLAKELLMNAHVKMTRQDFQLFSMTAMYLAVKLNNDSNGNVTGGSNKLDIPTLMDMSRGFFSMQDFEETELDILEALDWRVSPPTANCFLTELWSLIGDTSSNEHLTDKNYDWISASRHILEQSVGDAYFCSRSKSQLALAALMLAGKQRGVGEVDLDQFCHTIKDIVDINCVEYRAIYKQLRG